MLQVEYTVLKSLGKLSVDHPLDTQLVFLYTTDVKYSQFIWYDNTNVPM